MNEDEDTITSAQSAQSDRNSDSDLDFTKLVIVLNDINSYKEYIQSMNMRKTCQKHGWQTSKCQKCEINLNKHKMSYTMRYCNSELCNDNITKCPVIYKIFECLKTNNLNKDIHILAEKEISQNAKILNRFDIKPTNNVVVGFLNTTNNILVSSQIVNKTNSTQQIEPTNNIIVSSQVVKKTKATKRAREKSPLIWNPLSQQLPKKPCGRRRKVGSALQFE